MSGISGRLRRSVLAVGLTVALVSLAACGSSGAVNVSSGASTAKHLVFNANGTPDLKGLTMTMGMSGRAPQAGDTNAYDITYFLNKWGANVTYSFGPGNVTELAIASGRMTYGMGAFPAQVDAGLTVFGVNQARLDYLIFSKNSMTSLSDLKGKTIAVSQSTSPDYFMLLAALKKVNLTTSDVHIVYAGSEAAELSELLSGRADATILHSSALAQVGSKFHAMPGGSAADVLPDYADSFLAAMPSWLSAHPAYAEAIDLAWLASAKLFKTNQSLWVTQAGTYTKNASSASDLATQWSQLQAINAWPVAKSTFTMSYVQSNLTINKQLGAIQALGNRPLSQLGTTKYWDEAWTQYSQHESAY